MNLFQFGHHVSVSFFGLTTSRYTGFIYIGFIAAWWLYCDEMPDATRR